MIDTYYRKIIIKNGHVIDPCDGTDGIVDILIEDGKIKTKGRDLKLTGNLANECEIIDAKDMIVIPGLVDLHVHLREPGFEYKETIKTGTLAAISGGFTAVCCMPNTNPVNDNAGITEFILKKAESEGFCNVFPIGAITKGQKGEELAELSLMHEAGCIAFSDDGRPVMDSLVMRRALEYSRVMNVPIISHAEDYSLSSGGVMNEGLLAIKLGLTGIPAQAEEIMVARDIALAELTGGRLHIAHVSTKGSVDLIRNAKRRGMADITAETCPHYFSITEDAVSNYNTNAKVNPPLRRKTDIDAIKEGLKDGTLDVIATDHAPHHSDEKQGEFDRAPFGISGLETALGLSLMLVKENVLTIQELVAKMTINPSKIANLNKGVLCPGTDADVVIIDIGKEYVVNPAGFRSKGKNTPFAGWRLKGLPVVTISKGRIYRWT